MAANRVKITAYIVSIAYSMTLAVSGLHLPGVAAKLLSFIPSAVVVAVAIFDRWVWRIPPLLHTVARPNLIGTWRGELVSLRDDSGGVEIRHDPIPVVMLIRQSYTTISITLMTAESKSRSVAEVIQKNANGDYTIYYQYYNVPALAYRSYSNIHAGGTSIEVTGARPTTLNGEYWTARRSRGTFTVHLVSRVISGTFSEAMVLQSPGAR